ncbi:MAG: hypothetical protein P0S94_04755 [Simkaniaceae bacterium]|nr:hypothetical protein [Simkaniaceae bacterium]
MNSTNNTSNVRQPTADVNLGLGGLVRNVVAKMKGEYNETNSALYRNMQEESLIQAKAAVDSANAGVKAAEAGLGAAILSTVGTVLVAYKGNSSIDETEKSALEPHNELLKHADGEEASAMFEGDRPSRNLDGSGKPSDKEVREAKQHIKTIQNQAENKRAILQSVSSGVGKILQGAQDTVQAQYQGVSKVLDADAGIARDMMSSAEQLIGKFNQNLGQMFQTNAVVVTGAAIRG